MIIWVVSYPRSGNTFFNQVLAKAFGVKRASMCAEPEVEGAERLASSPHPVFVKTHRLHETAEESAIYLVRDGRDAVVSYAHFLIAEGCQGFAHLEYEEVLAALIKGPAGEFGTWSDNVRVWTRRNSPTAIVRFEELVRHPVRAVWDAVRTVGVPMTPVGPAPSFAELHERNPKVFRRGEIGAWRTELSASLEKLFWDKHGAEMARMAYQRDHPAHVASAVST